MARIAGVDLPRDKRVEIGLTYIYGIGRVSADNILAKSGVNPDTRCRDLTDDEVKRLSAVIDESQVVEGDLRREIGLTYIYGIGRTSASRILADAGVDPNTRVRDLTSEEVKKISAVIDETQVVEGDLRREIQLNIKRLKEIGCYRGIRHRKGLPVRGQKTKTNARTCKGPKRTVANKKK